MLRSVLVACALASLVTACSNGDDDEVQTEADGAVTLEWTLGGSADPGQCAAQGASAIQIDIYGQDGGHVGSYAEPCTDGSFVVELNTGRFSATAYLVDASGAQRTTTVDIDPFDIAGDATFTIPVDFPISSFL